MAKRTLKHRKIEESDSSSSEDYREKRAKKRLKRKSIPAYLNTDGITQNKSLISENKTSTPRRLAQDFQDVSAVFTNEHTAEHGRLEEGMTSDESFIPESEGEFVKQKGSESIQSDDGFVSFMKRFDFFSEDENSNEDILCHQNVINYDVEENDNYDSDDSDIPECQPDIPVTSCDLLTVDNVDNVADNYRKLVYHSKNVEVLFLKHPISVPIVGYLKVTLLSGRATILGYNLAQAKSIDILSQNKTGILTIQTMPHDKLNKKSLKIVRRHLKIILGPEAVPDIRHSCREVRGIFSTVIVLEEQPLPPSLEFLEYYLPEAVSGIKFNINSTSYSPVLHSSKHVINLSEEYEELFAKVEQHVSKKTKKKLLLGNPEMFYSDSESSSSEDESSDCSMKMDISEVEVDGPQEGDGTMSFEDVNPCIFLYGPKRSGKSTMLRYLLNKFLNSYREVFYLDTDAGQSEFTPPGTISLTRVTEPVFGPPFTHLRQPVKMIFIGTVTSETSPTMYIKSIMHLINYFLNTFPGKILFINTMGWITGLGDMMLQYIRKAAKPAVEVELEAAHFALEFTKPNRKVLKCKVGFHRDASTSTKKGELYPATLRNASLLAYFGRCQKSYLPLTPMNAFPPHQICWDNIFLYHFEKRVDHHRVYQALNCSIVGLCKVNKSLQLLSSNEDYPNTLEDEPINSCLGFGLVRSIDETNHILYIITPLSVDTLCHVNAIIGGNILVPQMVLLKQPIYDKELYYTDNCIHGPTEGRKAIQRRSKMNKTLST